MISKIRIKFSNSHAFCQDEMLFVQMIWRWSGIQFTVKQISLLIFTGIKFSSPLLLFWTEFQVKFWWLHLKYIWNTFEIHLKYISNSDLIFLQAFKICYIKNKQTDSFYNHSENAKFAKKLLLFRFSNS